MLERYLKNLKTRHVFQHILHFAHVCVYASGIILFHIDPVNPIRPRTCLIKDVEWGGISNNTCKFAKWHNVASVERFNCWPQKRRGPAPLHRCKRREVPGNDAYNGYKSHFAKLSRKCCHKIYKLSYVFMQTCSNFNIFTIYPYTRWKIAGKNVSFNLELYKVIKYRHQLVSFNSAMLYNLTRLI